MPWLGTAYGTPKSFYGAPSTPDLPAGYVKAPGDWVEYFVCEYQGNNTIPATPTGWTLLTSATTRAAVYGALVQADGTYGSSGSAVLPTVAALGTGGILTFTVAYQGGPTSVAGLINRQNFAANTSLLNFRGASLTAPTVDKCLIQKWFIRNKTSASNGTPTYSPDTTPGFTQRVSDWRNGAIYPAMLFEDMVQPTATALSTTDVAVNGVGADASAQTTYCIIWALTPAVPVLTPPKPVPRAISVRSYYTRRY